MQITKYRHSCLHVVDGDASVLIDPGTYSAGFESLTGLTAVLVTHAHGDHVDPQALGRLLAANPQATVYADSGTVALLAGHDIAASLVSPGDVLDVGTPVVASGGEHATIHRDIPTVPNVCYLIGGRLFHPGDSLTVPDAPVEILALPVAAPWMAVKEAVDYLREVRPTRAIPIHEQVLASTATTYRLLTALAPEGTTWTDLDDGETAQL